MPAQGWALANKHKLYNARNAKNASLAIDIFDEAGSKFVLALIGMSISVANIMVVSFPFYYNWKVQF